MALGNLDASKVTVKLLKEVDKMLMQDFKERSHVLTFSCKNIILMIPILQKLMNY